MASKRAVLYGISAVLAVLAIAAALFLATAGWAMRNSDFRSGVDLKQLACALGTYALDAPNADFPPLSSQPGRLMFDADRLYPEYISDPRLLISPVDPLRRNVAPTELTPADCFENSSYLYMGYKVWNDESVEAFADAYRSQLAQDGSFGAEELPARDPMKRLTRLREGRYYGMLTDEQANRPEWEFARHSDSETPLLIEWPHLYPGPSGFYFFIEVPLSKPIPGGCVVYQDGHTEFIPYPGKWPMTEKTISTLKQLAALRVDSSRRSK